jgi:hypothetical protein
VGEVGLRQEADGQPARLLGALGRVLHDPAGAAVDQRGPGEGDAPADLLRGVEHVPGEFLAGSAAPADDTDLGHVRGSFFRSS